MAHVLTCQAKTESQRMETGLDLSYEHVLNHLFPLYLLTVIVSSTHYHKHTGRRLWMNHSCPICRQEGTVFVDMRDECRHKEEILDRKILEDAIVDSVGFEAAIKVRNLVYRQR
jgi:hypothetical protein